MRASTILGFLARQAFSISFAILLLFAAGAVASAAPLALYVTDGDVVRGFDATTGAPLPGFSDIALFGATGLAFGPDNNLYAVTAIPSQVFRYDPATGTQ